MLDKLGLDKKDSEGFRLRTDNGRAACDLKSSPISASSSLRRYLEMVREHWKKIGI